MILIILAAVGIVFFAVRAKSHPTKKQAENKRIEMLRKFYN